MERMSKQFNASLILEQPRESRWTRSTPPPALELPAGTPWRLCAYGLGKLTVGRLVSPDFAIRC